MSEIVYCPHRPACDGCPNFELDPAASYRAKVDDVAQALAQYSLHAWPAPTAASRGRTLAYRNRARMIVAPDGQLGLYQAGTRAVVPVARCAVHEAAVEAVLGRVRAHGVGQARYVDVRANAAGEAIVTFGFEAEPGEAERDRLAGLADGQLSVHVNVGGKQTFLSGEQVCLRGAATLRMQVAQQTFEVPPAAFFQVNTEVLTRIHDLLRPWVGGDVPLWDIHCGVGVHGIACAAPGQVVRGADIDAVGVDAARQNAAQNGVAATYATASDDAVAFEGAGHAIVNPARAGLARELPHKLGAAPMLRLGYVSCEPRTFLRDAERLANAGFALRELHAFDMMPRTSHLELVGLFEHTAAPARWIELGEGVTGCPGEGPDSWVALLAGALPKRATLPGGEVTLERLRSVGDASVVRLTAPHALDHTELRRTLRRWKHPVIGDETLGLRSVNFRWRQDAALDVPALHRLRSGDAYAPVPDFFLTLFQLPRAVVEGRGASRQG